MEQKKEVYSYSKLCCFESCQYDYYLTYILGKRGGETVYTFLGTACHEILESLQKNEIDNDEAIERFLTQVEESDFLGLQWYSDKSRNDYITSIIHFFTNYKRYDNDVLMEQKFEMEIEGVLMKGFIDLVVFDKDNTHVDVYDYKTSTKFATKDLPHYGRQLVLYAYAIKKLYPQLEIKNIGWNMLKYALIQGKRKIKPELRCNIEENEWNVPYILEWKYDDETINDLLAFITDTVNEIEKKKDEDDYEPCDLTKNSYNCHMNCDHSKYCKHYQNYIKTIKK